MPKSQQARASPTVITHKDSTHQDPKEIADALNDHFITIGHRTSQTIPPIPQDKQQSIEHINLPPAFTLAHTTTKQVTSLLNKLNRNKTNDVFKIKPTIMRDLAGFIAPRLTTLFNQALDENHYPDPLKITKVIELYKAKDPTSPANYRPISLLPIIAKVFDTLLNEQIMTHLLKHDILSPTQYAFRPNSSTAMALQTILNKIYKHRTDKTPVLAIYVDLSKAYDTISHSKLLHKLKHQFNFTENTLNFLTFIASYFQNRQQTTHTQHAISSNRIITDGIPQGSTLSTTFFLLYINDIIKTVPNSDVYTFADDTTLIISAANMPALQKLAQTELNNLTTYFHTNNLVPNPTKTNYSIFFPYRKHPQQNITLTVNTTTLEQKTHAKLLGIIVQDDLKHNLTISRIVKANYTQSYKASNTQQNTYLPT